MLNFSASLQNCTAWFGVHALMHVVQQFDFFAQFLAADFEQLQRAAHVVRPARTRGLSCSALSAAVLRAREP